MSNNPRRPKLIKGALIEFSQRFLSATPNIIVFQFNPESMTRKLDAWYSGSDNKQNSAMDEPINAQPHDPPESFDLVLELDATDELENPVTQAISVISGVSRRIAAMEMLLYPEDEEGGLLTNAVQSLSATINNTISYGTRPVPRGKVPDLLFCWGPGRIVPVRLTSFSVEEQAYSVLLTPIRAKVTVGMKILQPRNLPCSGEESSSLLKTSYKIYTKTKQSLAAANMVTQSADELETIGDLIISLI